MTKYVLNSGGLRNNSKKTKEFVAEIVKDLGPQPKILMVLFAQPREDWEKKFVQYQRDFFSNPPDGVSLSFELAFPDTFEDQIEQSDALYIHGGDSHLLAYWFGKFEIPGIWKGKTVSTSSAGSNMLARHYWATDWRRCLDGLGIIPIKFIPHYSSNFGADDPRGPIDWENAWRELADYGDKSLPVNALEEGEFKVFEVAD